MFESIASSPELYQILQKAGWSLDRKVDIEKAIEILNEDGWEIFDVARQFIESFNGIFIPHGQGVSTRTFVAEHVDSRKILYQEFEEEWGKPIYPIGHKYGEWPMFIDSEGIIMQDFDNFMQICDKEISIALSQLLLSGSGRRPVPLHTCDVD